MRMSSLFLRTLRDDPADAEVDEPPAAGAGRAASGGWRRGSTRGCRSAIGCCANVAQIVREEMDEAGAQEVQPADRAAARISGSSRAATPPTAD